MELWDIYDKNKQKTGRTMLRNDWNMADGDFHLSVLCLVKTTSNKFLITRRALDKEWAAGHWELPGGGVVAGETSLDTFFRELQEETGIDARGKTANLVFSYKRENHEAKNNYFVDIYSVTMDEADCTVSIQESEVTGYKFATKTEIEEIASRGEFLHYDSIKEIFDK